MIIEILNNVKKNCEINNFHSSFCIFDWTNYMTLCASVIGVTSLIFYAKGNPFGQLLMVAFSLLCGVPCK